MDGIRRGAAICFGFALWLGLTATAANAQSLFETLFGARPARAALPPRYANPTRDPGDPLFYQRQRTVLGATASGTARATAGAAAYCVRLCDGRYFPLQHHVAASPVELCNS